MFQSKVTNVCFIEKIFVSSNKFLLGKCPLTHDGVFGLSDEHDVTNVPCGIEIFVF